MTVDVERPVICSKCGAKSGDDWKQCRGACPLPDSPHHKATTDKVELLPLPGDLKDRIHVYVDNSFARPKLIALMQDHARACVAHATATLNAEIARLNEVFDARERMLSEIEQAHAVEIEALRAENVTLTQNLADAMSEVANLDAAEAYAEQLAEALQIAFRHLDIGSLRVSHKKDLAAIVAALHPTAAQKNDDE